MKVVASAPYVACPELVYLLEGHSHEPWLRRQMIDVTGLWKFDGTDTLTGAMPLHSFHVWHGIRRHRTTRLFKHIRQHTTCNMERWCLNSTLLTGCRDAQAAHLGSAFGRVVSLVAALAASSQAAAAKGRTGRRTAEVRCAPTFCTAMLGHRCLCLRSLPCCERP